ncbi:MAG: DUF61 family protein [Methanomicrobiales archaeon]|jgi:uncharacterized protein (UPF0216 family)|nr:DUF61 family protein [Methanomicrobiales archaeon]
MTFGPPVSDESVLMRWMAFEMGKINDGVVADRRRLSDLVRELPPASITRGGREYAFNKNTIRILWERLPESLRYRIKLPLLFYFNSTVTDSFMLADATALEALQSLGELSDMREFIGGRVWVGRTIVFAIMGRYPGAIQIMVS